MRHFRFSAAVLMSVVLIGADTAPRAIELADILAWKRVNGAVVSNDGRWFAHRVTPTEGDSELVLRNLGDRKETRFPIGEMAAGFTFPGAPVAGVTFSDDSKWLAFSVAPTAKEAKQLKKTKKAPQSKAVLVELATGKKTEFEKIKRFAFSGENAQWIALHRYGADAPPAPPTPPAPGITPPDRPQGSDLLLYEMSSAAELNFGNVSEFSFNKKGESLAWIVDAAEKAGNGVVLRNMANGAVIPLDNGKAVYKGLAWTEKGDGLAALRGVEDKKYEDKLYSLVAFKDFTGTKPSRIAFDPKDDATFPKEMTLSGNRPPMWTENLDAVTFGIAELKLKKDADKKDADKKDEKPAVPPPVAAVKPDEPDKPDLVLWHWKDSRLQSMQQVQATSDKNFSYLSIYWPADKKFVRLADEKLRRVSMSPKDRFGIGLDVETHELNGSLNGQRFTDIYVVDLKTGARKLALDKNRYYFGPSPDGTKFLFHRDGDFWSYDMTAMAAKNLTKGLPTEFWDKDDDHNVQKPPTSVIGWTKDGESALLSDDWDVWNVPVGGGKAANLTGNGKKDKIRYQRRFRLDPEEKGIDLARPVYFGAYGEWTKKAGIGVVEGAKPGARMLTWDDASYNQILKAKNADVYLYTRDTHEVAPDFYSAGPMLNAAALAAATKVSDVNPQQKNFLWSKGSRLIDYTSDKGDKLQGALYLPANYEAGKKYPTIVYIYEKLSQGLNNYSLPTANGFNKSVYTSNGYAVFTPDIVYKINDPGMSAVWCILPGLKAAIATGVVDAENVALHGHSWGGYQTSFLVTQSNAFKAAIAGAPLTDLVSMYSSIYWNTGSANQPIFESSQGRFTSGYMDNPAPYIRNSPVYHAQNVKTPLMILHNDKDGAVDFTQGIEYYNTLRRLQKNVVMLQYKGENHGLAQPPNRKDYTVRMKEYFDHHLKGAPAPQWLADGVPHLKIKDHIDERVAEMNKAGKKPDEKIGPASTSKAEPVKDTTKTEEKQQKD